LLFALTLFMKCSIADRLFDIVRSKLDWQALSGLLRWAKCKRMFLSFALKGATL
jgi:hypothetical protein